jgi:hypothetical protein
MVVASPAFGAADTLKKIGRARMDLDGIRSPRHAPRGHCAGQVVVSWAVKGNQFHFRWSEQLRPSCDVAHAAEFRDTPNRTGHYQEICRESRCRIRADRHCFRIPCARRLVDRTDGCCAKRRPISPIPLEIRCLLKAYG